MNKNELKMITATPMDKLTETLRAAFAQYENEIRSEKIKRGIREAKLQKKQVFKKHISS